MPPPSPTSDASFCPWGGDAFTRFSLADVAVIAVALFLPLMAAWMLAGNRAQANGAGAKVEVFREDRLLGTVRLDQEGLHRVAEGMVLEVRSGKVSVAEADCPKGLCKHSGWVGRPGEVLVCVPNKVLVAVEGAHGPALDAVAR